MLNANQTIRKYPRRTDPMETEGCDPDSSRLKGGLRNKEVEKVILHSDAGFNFLA